MVGPEVLYEYPWRASNALERCPPAPDALKHPVRLAGMDSAALNPFCPGKCEQIQIGRSAVALVPIPRSAVVLGWPFGHAQLGHAHVDDDALVFNCFGGWPRYQEEADAVRV